MTGQESTAASVSSLPLDVQEANQRRADEIVADFPPLTGEQLAGLRDIFRPAPAAEQSRTAS